MEAEDPPLDGELRCAGGSRRAGGRRGGRPSKFCRFSRPEQFARRPSREPCGPDRAISGCAAPQLPPFLRTLALRPHAVATTTHHGGRRNFQRSQSPTTRRAAAPRSSRSRTCSSTSSAAAPRRCRPSARPARRQRRRAALPYFGRWSSAGEPRVEPGGSRRSAAHTSCSCAPSRAARGACRHDWRWPRAWRRRRADARPRGLPPCLGGVALALELRALAVPPHLLPRPPELQSKTSRCSTSRRVRDIILVDLVSLPRDATGCASSARAAACPASPRARHRPPGGDFGLTRLEALDASEGALGSSTRAAWSHRRSRSRG